MKEWYNIEVRDGYLTVRKPAWITLYYTDGLSFILEKDYLRLRTKNVSITFFTEHCDMVIVVH